MPNYVAISRTSHADKAFLKSGSYLHAAGDMFVPLLLDELPHVLSTTTIAFKRKPDQPDQYEIGALQSFFPGKNWYVVPDGRWLGGYIPAAYRGYPFAILPEAGTGKPALHFNQNSGLLVEKGDPAAQPFFGEDGELTANMNNVLNFLDQCQRSKQVTQIAVDALVLHQLLIPWEIKLTKGETETLVEAELFRVDEQAVKTLNRSALHYLHTNNAVALAYAQIFSQHRLSGLAKLYQLHQEFDKTSTTAIPDIDELFGEKDHDLFKFN